MVITARLFCGKAATVVIVNVGLYCSAYATDTTIDSSSGALSLSDGSTLFVEQSGSIDASSGSAVTTLGSSAITNDGSISGVIGIFISPGLPYDITIRNNASGIIAGSVNAILSKPVNNFTFTSSGIINGNITVGPVTNLDDSIDSKLMFENNNIINGIVNLSGEKVTIHNHGMIEGLGVRSTSGSITITNSGTIKTVANTLGIGAIDANGTAVIDNFGVIDSGSADGLAITGFKANKQTVNIYTGSKIIGFIDLARDADKDAVINIGQDEINVYDNGAKGSYSLAIRHQASTDISIKPGSNAVRLPNKGNTAVVTVVNATGSAAHGIRLEYLTSNLHSIIRDRLGHVTTNSKMQPMPNLSLELSRNENRVQLWGQVFGEHTQREAEGALSTYQNELSGFVAGYQYDFGGSQAGLLAGIAKSNFTTDHHNQNDDTKSAYIGIYAQTYFSKLNFITSVIAGYESHNNRRKVISGTITEIAESDNGSLFLSPSVALTGAFMLADRFAFRPSASLNYSISRYDNYKESGAGDANIQVDIGSTGSTSARIQFELAYALPAGEINVTAGVQSRYSDNDDINMSIAGSDFRYRSGIDSTVYGSYAGIGAYFALKNELAVAIDARYGEFNGGEHQVGGQVQLQYGF